MKVLRFNRIRLVGVLALAATAIIFGDTEQASAQTVDVSGAWTFEVTTDTGVTTPSLTLEQDGETLTGHYSSETLGEADVTGTVDGSTVTISFEADLGGTPISVIYVGTVDAEGVMTGTIDLANGTLTGTFTAKHPDA